MLYVGKIEKQGRIHGTRCAQYACFSPSKITRDGRTELRTDGRTDDLLQRCDGASKKLKQMKKRKRRKKRGSKLYKRRKRGRKRRKRSKEEEKGKKK